MTRTEKRRPTAYTKGRPIEVRSSYIDNIKGGLIFLVVFAHLAADSVQNSPVLAALYDVIYSFHIPLFVFMSGLLSKNDLKQRDMALRNFLGLYCFTVVATTFFSDAFCLISAYGLTFQWTQVAALAKDSLTSIFNATGPAWYLLSLIFWRVFTPYLKNPKILIVLVLASIAAGLIKEIGYTFSLSRTLVFFPYYLLGYYLDSDLLLRAREKVTRVHMLLSAGVLALLALMFYVLKPNPVMLYEYSSYASSGYSLAVGAIIRALLYIVAILAGACFLTLVPRKASFVTKWGQRSLNIYIWHIFLLPVMSLLKTVLDIKLWFVVIVLAVSLLSCRLLSAAAFERATEKIKNAFNRLVFDDQR